MIAIKAYRSYQYLLYIYEVFPQSYYSIMLYILIVARQYYTKIV